MIGFGFFHVTTANWHPFVPPNTGTFGEFGWSGVVRAAGVVFFAYIGFDAVSTAAQEARNPQKDMPIGILLSLGICTVLYILMSLVLTGVANYTTLNVPHPVAFALENIPALSWLTYLVEIGAILGLASVVLVMLMGQPRIFFSMARDGLLPPVFGKVHPKFGTPYITTIVTGTVAAIVAGIFPVGAARRARVDRDAARVRDRLRRRDGVAQAEPEHAAPVQDAARSARADPRHSDLRWTDGRAAAATPGFDCSSGWRSAS